MTWKRVSKKNPCPCCGRPDWCGYADGATVCMRVESDRPTRNGGWLHTDNFSPRPFVPRRDFKIELPTLDAQSTWQRWQEKTEHLHVDGFAMSLGVETEALESLGCAWSGYAWAFPMRDAERNVVGIRLRNTDGRKWAVKGSKSGLFIPNAETQKIAFIVEGPTDTAAALSIGLYAIGRPACLGLEDATAVFLKTHAVNRAVIIADNDEAGLRGSAKLQKALGVMSCQVVLPSKDIREFVNLGGTRADVENIIRDLVWQR